MAYFHEVDAATTGMVDFAAIAGSAAASSVSARPPADVAAVAPRAIWQGAVMSGVW